MPSAHIEGEFNLSDNFFEMPKSTRAEIIKGAAAQLGVLPQIIEKDIWLCRVLQSLFELDLAEF